MKNLIGIISVLAILFVSSCFPNDSKTKIEKKNDSIYYGIQPIYNDEWQLIGYKNGCSLYRKIDESKFAGFTTTIHYVYWSVCGGYSSSSVTVQ